MTEREALIKIISKLRSGVRRVGLDTTDASTRRRLVLLIRTAGDALVRNGISRQEEEKALEGKDRSLALVRARRAERAALRLKVLEAIPFGASRYSMEIGKELAMPVDHVRQELTRLEELGRLKSEKLTSPVSGYGRRYYRRVS